MSSKFRMGECYIIGDDERTRSALLWTHQHEQQSIQTQLFALIIPELAIIPTCRVLSGRASDTYLNVIGLSWGQTTISHTLRAHVRRSFWSMDCDNEWNSTLDKGPFVTSRLWIMFLIEKWWVSLISTV